MLKAFFYLVYVPFYVIKFIIEVIEKICIPICKYVIDKIFAPVYKQVCAFWNKLDLKYKEPFILAISLLVCEFFLIGVFSDILSYIVAITFCFGIFHILYNKFKIAKKIIWLLLTLILGFIVFSIVEFFVNIFIQNLIINFFIFIIATLVVGLYRYKYLSIS